MPSSSRPTAGNVDAVLLLRRHFGYAGFRPGQEELVRAAIDGRDALGVLPTGGGKSVCYQVPALALGGLTLVVTPLVSLMEDQVGRAREAGLRAAHLSSTQSAQGRTDIERTVRAGGLDVLFVAPERLESPAFRALLRAADVRLLAVDEAHCISEWGHDFRPSYRRIARVRALVGGPALALTASATPAVRADVIDNLSMGDPLVVVRSFDRPNLHWAVCRVGRWEDRLGLLYRLLRRVAGSSIVYAPTRRSVERVRDRLAALGFRAEGYHAGLAGPERSRVQAAFMADASRVVVATNAFGMGIDKPDVRLVVHMQLPTTLEAYYQEAGRAGRDGAPSYCIAFHGRPDRRLGLAFIDRTHPRGRALRRAHRRLRALGRSDGVVRPDDPGLRVLFGADLDPWRAGDPVGVLGALERSGAVRRIPREVGTGGTEGSLEGSEIGRIGVRRRLDGVACARQRQAAREKLHAVERFATTRMCRRDALLRYFGEDASARCGRCDRCSDAFLRLLPNHA